jgi:hypothetical protein
MAPSGPSLILRQPAEEMVQDTPHKLVLSRSALIVELNRRRPSVILRAWDDNGSMPKD